jgi:hypothetical protein
VFPSNNIDKKINKLHNEISYSIRKLYLIPTTMGDCDPMDVLPQTVKRTIDFIDYYIVENEKQLVNQRSTSRKKQSELVLLF